MASLNRVELIGHLGADPDLRTTQGGMTVVTMNMATNEKFQKDGEWVDRTEWHRVVVWGKTAEACGKYLSKGKMAYVDGRLQTREWTDKEGVKRYTTEIVANHVLFLSDGRSDGRSDAHSTTAAKTTTKTSTPDDDAESFPF